MVVQLRSGVVQDDLEPCTRLWIEALTHRDGMIEGAAARRLVSSRFTRPIVRFAVADPPVAGFALTVSAPSEGDSALLDLLAVAPAAEGRGIGRALLDDAVDRSRAAGFAQLALVVRPSNVRAIALYRSAGFVAAASPRTMPHGPQMIEYRRALSI